MYQNPFIHLFKTSNGYYFYDVNTDSILNISKDSYEYLNNQQKGDSLEAVPKYINFLKNKGYLKSNRVKTTEHPDTEFLKYYCSNRIEGIILQVTQSCNLRCEYCTYSGGYANRTHSSKKMTYDMAKQGIDFYIKHSRDCNELSIGFYGGEPLLEFKLIKQCIDYAKSHIEGKNIRFNLTTNATLLTEEIVRYFDQNNVSIMISLDGPREIHDKNRKFANSGNGSFDTVMEKVRMIYDNFHSYFEKNVHYNTVLETDNFSCVNKFIEEDHLLENALFLSSVVNELNRKEKTEKTDQFYEESRYALFIGYLHMLGKIEKESSSKLLQTQLLSIADTRKGKQGKQRDVIPEKWHHGGPCIPGIMRLFINSDGNFYPCEKVCEISNDMIIGNLNEGYDLEKIIKILNIETIIEEKCHDCWAYSDCRVCVGCISAEPTEKELDYQCKKTQIRVENDLKDYCVLRDLGYDFETRESRKL
ncbi:Cys-rich peptide radical SAM maturase CcpM [Clostridium tagluense]|uniref:Cys-rich peptide radical SAM maturase CcpM n=1 Tax=Clostridium tagluense TaxID=360422 RepID=UPI001C6EC752|nr:Cys-rich peptide radical SAM maturase CcpM [Clostridium tagluense]MBW9159133.1 Cys-rich peptide radical SAM maturase CcpM [Clostridium tagluense]WLC68218.1 Cys-rich peptide radical SAM maturase CcpM [Clostridium tagluense]